MSIFKKVVVIGGTGLVGSKVVGILGKAGQEAVVASPQNSIDAFTGEGLETAFAGADAVIDVSNMMSFDESVIRNFFGTSSRNLTNAGKAAGVRHHVVLSIVGSDRLGANPYMSGKLAQEETVKASGQDYTIVRATQFYEFMATLADAYATDDAVIVPDVLFQPMAAHDVAVTLVRVALGEPHNGIIEVGGPESASFKSVMDSYLKAKGDTRPVRAETGIDYFGAAVGETSLIPAGNAIRGQITLAEFLGSELESK